MDARELLRGVLGDFSGQTGVELKLDERDGCSFFYADTTVNLTLLPKSGQVLLWITLGKLLPDANAPRRAMRLLELHDAWEESRGATFMMDPATDVVMVMDRRSIDTIGDADAFAAWVEAVYAAHARAWSELEFEFPYVDDDPLEPEAPLIREIDDGKEPR